MGSEIQLIRDTERVPRVRFRRGDRFVGVRGRPLCVIGEYISLHPLVVKFPPSLKFGAGIIACPYHVLLSRSASGVFHMVRCWL